MTDKLTKERRSANMRAIRGKNTKPEMIVRRLAHDMGYRFRLHRADLPGKPDLTFPRHRAVIQVNGCFWHGHRCKRGKSRPETNAAFWSAKITRNKERDRTALQRLGVIGWRALVLWECELKDAERLRSKIQALLGFRESSV